jgi:hypothetical protein
MYFRLNILQADQFTIKNMLKRKSKSKRKLFKTILYGLKKHLRISEVEPITAR